MKNILHDFEIRHKYPDYRSLEHIRRGSRFLNEESPGGPGRNEWIDSGALRLTGCVQETAKHKVWTEVIRPKSTEA